jgi:hypothetical protein
MGGVGHFLTSHGEGSSDEELILSAVETAECFDTSLASGYCNHRYTTRPSVR